MLHSGSSKLQTSHIMRELDLDLCLSIFLYFPFTYFLLGLTDAADHWRCFLLNHGGLLPRHLRGKPVLGAGNGKVRRKRK